MGSRIYTINAECFSEVSSEADAYWLGFIAADGHLFRGGGCLAGVSIELAPKDTVMLVRCRDFLGSNAPITDTSHTIRYKNCEKTYTQPRLRVCSTKLVRNLQKWGLCEQKSTRLVFASKLPSHLVNHYLRGYYDGDGSCTWEDDSSPRIQFLGTAQFLSETAKNLQVLARVNLATVHPGSGDCYRILYGGAEQVRRLRDWLYKDHTQALERKRDVLFRA